MAKKKTTPSLDLSPAKVQSIAANWEGEGTKHPDTVVYWDGAGAKEFAEIFKLVEDISEKRRFVNSCIEALIGNWLKRWNEYSIPDNAEPIQRELIIEHKEAVFNDFEAKLKNDCLLYGIEDSIALPLKYSSPTVKGLQHALYGNTDYFDLICNWPGEETMVASYIAAGAAWGFMKLDLEKLKAGKQIGKREADNPTKELLGLFASLINTIGIEGHPELKRKGNQNNETYCELICEKFGFGHLYSVRVSKWFYKYKSTFSPTEKKDLSEKVLPFIKTTPEMKEAILAGLERVSSPPPRMK